MSKTWIAVSVALVLVALAPFAVPDAGAGPQAGATPTGNAERGRDLYQSATALKCYACHGFEGETGSPRLVPMAYDQGSFIDLVQRGTRGMPAYNDVGAQDLADIYAFLNSIEPDAPEPGSVPLLDAVLGQIEQAR